ncbi:PEGA domain-containing protein [candidate division WWE3 bacterium]|nr:PEGA domain-containing protein [candidate division WWE3 bacterium]
MEKNYLLRTLITAFIILSVSTLLYLYTAGYRLQKEEEDPVDIRVTGMISAKSIPESASVYLDEELVTATNDSIPGIPPGKYTLKITKNGFTPWEKEIEVFPELVTDITAVLVSETPRIEPLTNTGARSPRMSPSLSALAYFSKDPEKPGVWVMPLTYNRLDFFSSAPKVVLEDTAYVNFSEGLDIQWSPKEDQLLVQQAENSFYLVDLVSDTAKSVTNYEEIQEEWAAKIVEMRKKHLEKALESKEFEMNENLQESALKPETSWAPDDKKFLYVTKGTPENGTNGLLEYRVFNMEDPLPVGEKRDNLVFTTNPADPQPKLTWYSDNFHLIMLEKAPEENSGVVSLIRIDGTNKRELYNNVIFSDRVFSSPGGDKVVLLTSFRTEGETNLYTVSVR